MSPIPFLSAGSWTPNLTTLDFTATHSNLNHFDLDPRWLASKRIGERGKENLGVRRVDFRFVEMGRTVVIKRRIFQIMVLLLTFL